MRHVPIKPWQHLENSTAGVNACQAKQSSSQGLCIVLRGRLLCSLLYCSHSWLLLLLLVLLLLLLLLYTPLTAKFSA
jgi:hypothetical protein